MITQKKHKIVILPTNEINRIGDICLFEYGLSIAGISDIGYPVQHLYILSDDKVIDGDWYMNGKHIYQADRHYEKASNDEKIIATTNSSLKIINSDKNSATLPKIHISFIYIYITEYNNDNIIKDVNVEYDYIGSISYSLGEGKTDDYPVYEVKINVDNTINISSIEDDGCTTIKFNEIQKNITQDALNYYWNHIVDMLNKNNLGDIERVNLKLAKTHVGELLNKFI